jgi:dsRNA-specific ribonuclease
VCPEFLLWAVSGSGLAQPRRSYEVLETYGDTILKFAATLCSYQIFKSNAAAGEGEIENTKVLFVTNFNTFRIGYFYLKVNRFIRLCKDAEPKDWSPPLQGVEPRKGKCTGGSMADSVESLIGALFLTTDSLHKVL